MSESVVRITGQKTSYQGTGHLLGVRQNFVRLAGCSVKECHIRQYCDEPLSLNRHSGSEKDIQGVIDLALGEVGRGGWLHVTGGEPTDQPEALERLLALAHREGLRVHLQTAGIRSVSLPFDWITVSPKEPARKLHQPHGHELIVVYDGHDLEELRDYENQTRFWFYYLVPRWTEAHWRAGDAGENAKETVTAIDRLNSEGGDWRLTLQAHKHLSIY